MYGLDDIQFVGTRHEQGAAFMALGYAHATGRPGVCMVTNGPGATNMVTGVAGAYVTHAPMVAIVGGISQEHMGRDSFQELDHVGVFKPVAKASFMTPNARTNTGHAAGCLSCGDIGEDGPGIGGHTS